ncbi:MAG TPA: alkaline phosphatase family protein [Actinomycetota bacterium]|nr:alkaline phosphatase family protein [Actinomycetota bacterium]
MSKRAVVIGLDGVAWHLLDPMMAKGLMPRLAAIRDRGASGTAVSTVPTYTPPAWTSAATGVNPGRHGIYGFYGSNAQSEHQELMHSGKIKSSTIWEMANAQGAKVGVYNLPLTYPPQKLEGWMVSGMMTPGFGEKQRGISFPPELEDRILTWAPDYVVDVSANWETDWKDAALCDRVVASLEQRFAVLEGLLETDPVDVVFSVLEAPDRMQHVYYRYMDPNDDLYDSPEGRELRPAIERCFAAMDRVVGLLDDYAGLDGGAIVCSDHGFTAWEVSVHTNTLLAEWGYLKLKPVARAMQTSAARSLVPLAKRVLPAKTARQAKGKTFAAVDWAKTKAFASPIPQQGIFVNLAGRERYGIVPPAELEGIKEDLVRRFKELKGPDGSPVTDVVWRAEDVFDGDAVSGAPDVMPVLKDHRYELDDELFHKEAFTDLRHLPRGVHHPNGIVVVAGPGVAASDDLKASIKDITPTLLYMAGLKVAEDLDGRVIEEAFRPEHLKDHPVEKTSALSSAERDETSPYSAEEEAMIEESLRGLGYL